ncbi:LysR family transcriptional regulator [Shewanella khirikhana]|uniref:HTH-type transcriptional regulator LeuO n=1 Tax=Shewanella khirikhana TaxID=1965282 RepID=A0ABM7DPD7_9GAMM|nr:LysR family transcriptional regulator [Shewanella khirikhana]AZQ11533.1 HTH-type transcriptional regulator LeuO [Shewanella khirikhana]
MLSQADIARIRSCDLNLLVCLVVLIEEQSVSRSAERLGLSQPTMSQKVKKIQTLFGEPLFIKQGLGIIATDKALKLHQPLEQWLLLSSQLLQKKPFFPEEAKGKISLGLLDDVAETLIPRLLEQLIVDAPNVELEFVNKTSNIFSMLESGKLDLAVGGVDVPPPNIHGRRTVSENYLVFFSQNHPLAKLANPSIQDVFHWEHARFSGSNLIEQEIDLLAQELGLTRKCSFSCSSNLVLLQSLKANRHLAFLPERFLKHSDSLLHLALPEIPSIDSMIYWHAKVHKEPLIQWFKDLCIELTKNMIKEGHFPQA